MPESVQAALYTRHDAARVLKRSVSTIIRLERAGELEPIKLRGPKSATLYRVEQVDALALAGPQLRVEPTAKPRRKIERRRLKARA